MRVYEYILKRQKLPPSATEQAHLGRAPSDIAYFEEYLTRQGTIILKFFLYLFRNERKSVSWSASNKPGKHWKFSASDVEGRKFQGGYIERSRMQFGLRHPHANRGTWCRLTTNGLPRLCVAAAIVEAMERLDLAYPTVDAKKTKEL